jgi:hypothetical protein
MYRESDIFRYQVPGLGLGLALIPSIALIALIPLIPLIALIALISMIAAMLVAVGVRSVVQVKYRRGE